MNIGGKIISIINLFYAILLIAFIVGLSLGGILGVLSTTIGLGLLILPIIIGIINSIVVLKKSKWSLSGKSVIEKLFIAAPISNILIIVGAVLVLVL